MKSPKALAMISITLTAILISGCGITIALLPTRAILKVEHLLQTAPNRMLLICHLHLKLFRRLSLLF